MAAFLPARVARARDHAPRIRHRTLAAELAGAAPASEAAVRFPSADGKTEERHYSIWKRDAGAGTFDLCVTLHGNGPGSRWARACREGDAVEVSVSRALPVELFAEAGEHVFLGDETSIATADALMRALPDGARARAIFEMADPAHRWPDAEIARPADVAWIAREGRPGASLAAFAGALRLPDPERAAAYVTGEAWLCASVAAALVKGAGLPPHHVRALPFWKRRAAL
jgi:NADPH-dependent ferric siderophore reductase